MKNLRVSHKLIVSFAIVTLLACIVGIIGFIGIKKINVADKDLYENQTKPMGDISNIIDYLQRSRIKLRDLIVFGDNEEKISTFQTSINTSFEKVEEHILALDQSIKNDDAKIKYDDAKTLYTTMFKPLVFEIISSVKKGTSQENIYETIAKYADDIDKMLEYFNDCLLLKMDGAHLTVENNASLTQTMLTIIISIIIITIIIVIFLVRYISNMISKPIRLMSAYLKNLGTTGNITVTPQDEKNIEDANDDEIGLCIKTCAMVVTRLMDLSKDFTKIANGDLTVNVVPLSEDDNMGIAIAKMVKSLNAMFHEIKTSSGNVASGAEQIAQVTEQIAQGAQSLADGSSEQSASVQELLSSSTHIKKQVDENTKLANDCVDNVNISGDLMKDSVTSMGEMLEAMTAIDESSKSIANVIKVIDDIAAQTNLLALNAAIEASRVGDAGKGFAVVADEVRKLSAMSAEAAKETAELVENSLSHVNHGSKIVEQTNQNLEAASKKTMEIEIINKEIASSLMKQSASINKINSAINEVSEVVQSNGAAAEESAAAAEESASVASEISSQAISFNAILKKFKLNDWI